MKVSRYTVLKMFTFIVCIFSIPALSKDLKQEKNGREASASPWVKWPTLSYLGAGKVLGDARLKLLKENMIDTNAADLSVDPLTHKKIICNERSLSARTLEGSCNLLDSLKTGTHKFAAVGMRGMPFGRNIPEKETFPKRNDKKQRLISPTPSRVANELMTRKEFLPAKTLNVLAAAWIQFMTHDWFFHSVDGKNDTSKKINLGDGKKMYQSLRIKPEKKNLGEDKKNKDTEGGLEFVTRNQVTHWWDGSQLYGWDEASHKRVRQFKDGLMKIGIDGNSNLLPIDPEVGSCIAGARQGMWVGVSFLHHLFVREHNFIAKKLQAKNPNWTDQKLFDVSRLIVSALMAKIHTIEWTPAVISHPIAFTALQANWNGNLSDQAVRDSLAGYRKVNPRVAAVLEKTAKVLGGIVGGKASQDGVNYALTEEFTAVYRMHPLLPEVLKVDGKEIPMLNTVGPYGAALIRKQGGFGKLLPALGTNYPGALTLYNFPSFLRKLPVPPEGNIMLDMAAVDVGRDRERGIPRYNKFRESLGLKRLTKFEDFIDQRTAKAASAPGATREQKLALERQQKIVKDLKRLYQDDIDSVDLLIGSLAENTRPEGFGFGETSFQIFILNASRRLLTDRFFNEGYNEKNYSQFGLDWIAQQTMSSIILRHYGEGKAVANVLKASDNAFTPWGKEVPVPTHPVRNTLN